MNNFSQILDLFIRQAQGEDLKITSYPKEWNGLCVKVSFGMGSPAHVPWIAFIAPGMQVSNGFFPVYLYYKQFNTLILSYGISETEKPSQSWPIEIFNQNPTVSSYFNKKVPRYGDSFVFKAYNIKIDETSIKYIDKKTEEEVSNINIEADLSRILEYYKNITSLSLKMDNKKIEKYLREFKDAGWIEENKVAQKQHSFFKTFFKKENLEKANWEDFQDMGEQINAFFSNTMAKKNAFGRPNHKLQYYRDSIIYLIYGEDDDIIRFNNFSSGRYKIDRVGKSAVSEIIGQAFPEKYVHYNRRDVEALKFLGIDFKEGKDFGTTYIKYNEAIKPIIDAYKKIVGLQDKSLTIPLEVDQFFSYLYETKINKDKKDKEGVVGEKQSEKGVNYWWLNTNPKIWDLANAKIGFKQTYTSHNEKGNPRRIFSYFKSVKPGDRLIGYVSTPVKEVVALCEVTKGLQKTKEGEAFEFKKIRDFKAPVSFQDLQKIEELWRCEPLKSNQGSLFKLTDEEYEIIVDILDERNQGIDIKFDKYSKKDALNDLFLGENEFNNILRLLDYKKNIILQGPPGVGKTFIAKRIAFASMGSKDTNKVQMIQFHQSYSYEDFMQGYRPAEDGNFELKNGVFFEFCKRAQKDKDNKYFFIIDEINRGNLSKIFGEMMMLMEKDKRGEEFAIPLTYSESQDNKFYIPENVYLIGTMNTADKSLAMVDYALRRRFCFIFLGPKFDKRFKEYLKSSRVKVALIDKIIEKVSRLNDIIKNDNKNLGKGYMIGHSYFCPDGSNYKYDEEWYKNIVKNEIKPLLEEYWFDNEEKVEASISVLMK